MRTHNLIFKLIKNFLKTTNNYILLKNLKPQINNQNQTTHPFKLPLNLQN